MRVNFKTYATVHDEAIEKANEAEYRLCASELFTEWRLLLNWEVGTVWENCWLIRSLEMPFGGRCKQSGTGREGMPFASSLEKCWH